MKRRDRPDPRQLTVDLGGVSRYGFSSGGPIAKMRAGWFLPIGNCDRVHWFDVAARRGVKVGRRLCDGVLVVPGDLLMPGTWPSCARCRRTINGGTTR